MKKIIRVIKQAKELMVEFRNFLIVLIAVLISLQSVVEQCMHLFG